MRGIYKNTTIKIFCFLFIIAFALVQSNASAQVQQKQNPEKVNITNQVKTLTIYPVPVTTKVHIRISPALRQEVNKIEIINLIGRKVAEQYIIDPSTTDISFTNMNQYPSGVYMVIARDKYGEIVKSAKMIINK